MVQTGADLIRTSGHNVDRAHRMKLVDAPVMPVDSPNQNQSSLDDQTHGALLRFAHFINKEGQEKKRPKPKPASPRLPDSYQTQVANLNQEERSGAMINIYA